MKRIPNKTSNKGLTYSSKIGYFEIAEFRTYKRTSTNGLDIIIIIIIIIIDIILLINNLILRLNDNLILK